MQALCETCLHFEHNTAKLKQAFRLPPLDEVEQSLLNTIASQVAEGKPSLLVGDIIYSKQIGSPATLQRRLSKLAEMEFIRYGSDLDGRKKTSNSHQSRLITLQSWGSASLRQRANRKFECGLDQTA